MAAGPSFVKVGLMDTQTFVQYEVAHFASGEQFVTESRDEALGYFEEGWIVTEHCVTICKITSFASTQIIQAVCWNTNPEFDGE